MKDIDAKEFIDLIENKMNFDEREKLRELRDHKNWYNEFWELINNSKNPKIKQWIKNRLDRIITNQHKKYLEKMKENE